MRAFRLISRFRRETRGATAIEFAVVAVPFFLTTFATIDNAVLYVAQQTLENAVLETSRLVRTGRIAQEDMDEIEFRARICDMVDVMLACDARLEMDLRVFGAFAGLAAPDATDGAGDWNPQLTFDPGEAGDIILYRVFYEWQMLTPIVSQMVTGEPDGTIILTASAAFRNEPFEEILP